MLLNISLLGVIEYKLCTFSTGQILQARDGAGQIAPTCMAGQVWGRIISLWGGVGAPMIWPHPVAMGI